MKELKKYFKRKQQNYILRQLPLHIINSHKNIKDLLYFNPLMFQECFEYYCNPLTPEEQLIGEILEIKNIKARSTNTKTFIQNILNEMEKKYKGVELNEVLMFIICNVYQNAIETNNEELINLTKYSIENPVISNQQIINFFTNNFTKNLVRIVQAFIDYNEKIKEDHLNKLKEKPSYQYVKERLKKPN